MRLVLLRRLAIALGLSFGVALLFVSWLGPVSRGLQAELFALLAFFFLVGIASTASRSSTLRSRAEGRASTAPRSTAAQRP